VIEDAKHKATTLGILGAVVLVAIAVIAVDSRLRSKPSKEVTQPCVAGPNERCPAADWMKSYEEFQAAQDKLKADMQEHGYTDRQRMLAGWAQDLGKGIPTQEGYNFDDKSKKFVKPALPPQPETKKP
jgi:hypothetical protein